jgi:spermidine/putrescine transport system permease protein
MIAVLPPTVPLLILALSLLMFLSWLGISGTLTAVFVSHVVICTPFAMAIVRLRLADMDRELEEAAWNLGASQWQAVRRVILPFAAPGIAAAFMITLAVSFDEFMIAWFVSGLDVTLPVKILALLQGQVSPRINAIGTMVFTITIILVGLAQVIFVLWKPDRSLVDATTEDG